MIDRRRLIAGGAALAAATAALVAITSSTPASAADSKVQVPTSPGHTSVSWKAAPPKGRTGSEPISVLMPWPLRCAELGWMPSAISTPRCMPAKNTAFSATSPRRLPSVTGSPSAMPSSAASLG